MPPMLWRRYWRSRPNGSQRLGVKSGQYHVHRAIAARATLGPRHLFHLL
jgi:hypothetical protein